MKIERSFIRVISMACLIASIYFLIVEEGGKTGYLLSAAGLIGFIWWEWTKND